MARSRPAVAGSTLPLSPKWTAAWRRACRLTRKATGDPSEFASRITIARLAQAGIVPTSTNAVLCEFQQHWNRGDDNQRFASLYGMVAPNYAAVIESYVRAQQAAKEEAVTA